MRIPRHLICAGIAILVGTAACQGDSREPQEAATPGLGSQDSAPAAPDSAPVTSAASPDALTAIGWRDLRIGMTRAEVVAAAGEDANPGAVGGPDPASCDEFRPEQAPDGLLVMIRNGRLSRIAIHDGPSIETDRGIAVNDSSLAVETAYGASAITEPHAFLAAPAAYKTVWRSAPPSPETRGIVYEIGVDGRVTRILAGDESIQFVEGCI